MLLNKFSLELVSLIIAGALQGSSATPVPEPSEGGLMVRGVGSSLSLQPAAAPPGLFFYDPAHMSQKLRDVVIPTGDDVCNMLLSVKRKGDQVRCFDKPHDSRQTAVFAFPACNHLPQVNIYMKMDPLSNISSINEELYGELLLLQDIIIGDKEDQVSFAKGTVRKLQAHAEPKRGGEKGPEGYETEWKIVDYTGSPDVKFNGQSGLLTGPYPNPYRLIYGQEFPNGKDFTQLRHLPLTLLNGGSGLPVMWIYRGPKP